MARLAEVAWANNDFLRKVHYILILIGCGLQSLAYWSIFCLGDSLYKVIAYHWRTQSLAATFEAVRKRQKYRIQ